MRQHLLLSQITILKTKLIKELIITRCLAFSGAIIEKTFFNVFCTNFCQKNVIFEIWTPPIMWPELAGNAHEGRQNFRLALVCPRAKQYLTVFKIDEKIPKLLPPPPENRKNGGATTTSNHINYVPKFFANKTRIVEHFGNIISRFCFRFQLCVPIKKDFPSV